MKIELITALSQLESEKGISKEIIMDAMKAALLSAYKKDYGTKQNIDIDIDTVTGRVKVFAHKNVVESVEDETVEISLDDAKTINPDHEVGDTVDIDVTPKEFGRIAAQTAKQVVIQRIREAERDVMYEKFLEKEGDIVTGIVQRREGKNVFIELSGAEGVLTPKEQIPNERYEFGQRAKVYVLEVKKTPKGPLINVSRTHSAFLKRLFELEVPEIYDGTIEIVSVAREAGSRSKVAVYSKEENVDAVGACVGQKGSRVQTIVDEIGGEKVDIVPWEQDSSKYIANALSPAKVLTVNVDDDQEKAHVVVPDDQLSLAIGKAGQNARLAARLTGKKIDIRSRSQIIDDLTAVVPDKEGTSDDQKDVDNGEIVDNEGSNESKEEV